MLPRVSERVVERSPVLEALACGLLCFLVYAATTQDSFFSDGAWLLTPRAHGEWLNQNHPLFYPLIGLVQAGLRPWTSDLFTVMSLASNVYMAIGVAFANLAFGALGLPRERRIATTLLVGATPAVWFYGSCIELPAPFFATVGAWFWMLARATRTPGRGAALLVGCASGLATAAHATGNLLVTITWAWFVCVAVRNGFRASVRLALWATLAHGVCVAAMLGIVRVAAGHSVVGSQASLVRDFGGLDWQQLGPSLWHEWLHAFAPISVLWLWPLLRGPLERRRLALVVALPWLVYQTGSFLVLRFIDEHGTYMIPLVLPAAYVAQVVLPGRTVWIAVTFAATTAFAWNREWANHDPEIPTRQQVEEVTAGGRATLLYSDVVSQRPIVRYEPLLQTVPLWVYLDAELTYDGLCEFFDRWVEAQDAEGRPVLLATRCWQYLHWLKLSERGKRFLDEHLGKLYLGPEERVGSWTYYRIRKRGGK